MTYKNDLLTHLGRYRQEVLGIETPGTYKGREYGHILPEDQMWLGIPAEARDLVRRYVGKHNVKLHQYFHHLNSSQAFGLSLFVPFFEGSPASQQSILGALGLNGELAAWRPERISDPAEGTNVDAWWCFEDGREVHCEVKITEGEFGSAKIIKSRLRKLEEIYEPKLRHHLSKSAFEPETFFASYQIYRNLWQVADNENGTVLFLFPCQQKSLTRQLNEVLKTVTSRLRDRVMVVHSETLLARLIADPRCPKALRDYAQALVDKFRLVVPCQCS